MRAKLALPGNFARSPGITNHMADPSANQDAISALNDLIETCHDGENGFRAAAEGLKSSQLQMLFSAYARQRSQFAVELQQEVRRLGGDAEKAGSMAGGLHRIWANIKSVVSGGSEPEIVSEAERGEDQAVKSYREALGANLPENTRAIVARQFRQVQEAHDRIRSLQQQRRAA